MLTQVIIIVASTLLDLDTKLNKTLKDLKSKNDPTINSIQITTNDKEYIALIVYMK